MLRLLANLQKMIRFWTRLIKNFWVAQTDLHLGLGVLGAQKVVLIPALCGAMILCLGLAQVLKDCKHCFRHCYLKIFEKSSVHDKR